MARNRKKAYQSQTAIGSGACGNTGASGIKAGPLSSILQHASDPLPLLEPVISLRCQVGPTTGVLLPFDFISQK